MTATAEQNPQAIVAELAKLVKENLPVSKLRHDMVNMLTGLGSHIYIMEGRLKELEDALQELIWEKFAQ